MLHTPINLPGSCPIKPIPFQTQRRVQRGKTAYHRGVAAELSVEQLYQKKCATILGRRVKTPYGELDLVAEQNGALIFIEVKARRHENGWDSPVSARQWQRLKNAANHYMLPILSETGVQPGCRFDVAMVDRIGKITLYENACSFEEH